MPLLVSAVGRVFLAYLPEALTGPVLKSQYGPDEKNPFDEDEIEQVKATVRGEGVAFTSGTLIPGLASLAAPVFTTGSCAAASSRHRAAQAAWRRRRCCDRCGEELLATSAAISAGLGYSADHESAGF